MGKSRLLLEFGIRASEEKDFRVLWGNVEEMVTNNNWLTGIVPDLPTVLLLDEPSDARLISRLAEQMKGAVGRLGKSKAVISTRSPKDHVLRAYRDVAQTLRHDSLELRPVTMDQANGLILNLIQNGKFAKLPNENKAALAEHIAIISVGLPVWMGLAMEVLETTDGLDSLPKSVAEYAQRYLSEVVRFQPDTTATQSQTESLVRWLALYRCVNTEKVQLISYLAKRTGFQSEAAFKRALQYLVTRKYVISRGVNGRLHEIKPYVITDFILSDWLTFRETGRPSGDAEELSRRS